MNLKTKIWLLTSAIVALIMAVDVMTGYRSIEDGIRTGLEEQAQDIRGMLMAMRRIYHQQFLASGLPVNEKTVGFLPAHALSRISRDFPNWSRSGMSFNNVSDQPRNPANRADKDELAAMAWFRAHPKDNERLTEIVGPGGKPYYHFTAPIWIEKYCLTCHGRKEDAPASIAQAYSEAYGYKVGDLRGVMSIKLPAGPLREREYLGWLSQFSFRLAGYVALLLLLGMFLNRVVVARLARLERAAGRLAGGDYAARADADGQDEVGSLSQAFNHMAGAIQDHAHDLKESEERFRTATESMRDAFVLIEAEGGTVLWWNKAAEGMFGYGREEILGKPLHEMLLHGGARLAMGEGLARFARSGEGALIGRTQELMARRRDGQEFHIELSLSAMPLGGRWQAVGVVRDITERRHMEEIRQRQLSSMKALNEIGAISGLSLEEQLHRALEIGARLLGLEFGIVSHVLGNDYHVVAQFSPPDTLKDGQVFPYGETYCSLTLARDDVLAIQDMGNSAYVGHPCYRMFRLESYVGAPLRVAGQAYGTVNFSSPVAYGRAFDEGDREFMALLARWVGGAIERDDVKQHLEELVDQRTSELNSLFQALPDMYFRMDRDGTILDSRCGRSSDLYVAPEFFLGRRMQDVLPPEVGQMFSTAFARLNESGGEGSVEYNLPMLAGSQFFEARLLPLGENQMVAVVRNITERRAMEEAREAARQEAVRLARLRSEFLANMSHEIRTPLNGVLGMAQIGFRGSEPGSKAAHHFERILESGRLLLSVVNDILDFSRIEAGKMPMERVAVDLRRLVSEAGNLVAERAHAKGVEFLVEPDRNLPSACLGDPMRLAQILANLLSNAVKFTLKGRVTLSAGREAGSLIFRVADTGIGMSAEQVERLFSPFEQADGSTTRKFGGTGLGLSIARRLAELMGGTIRVQSTLGEGSRFELRIPYLLAEEPGSGTAGETTAEAQRLAGITILVAEDNELNRFVLQEMLSEEGAKVALVADGQQALDAVLREGAGAWDIVLMDIQMPVMDGLEATRRILSLAPDLPIVGQTAHAMTEEREKCRAAGMVAHLAKPIDLDELVAVVQKYRRGANCRAGFSPPIPPWPADRFPV